MKFYAHLYLKEASGTQGRYIWEDLKTYKGAIQRAKRIFAGQPFTVYVFTNFYDNNSFKCIHQENTDLQDLPLKF